LTPIQPVLDAIAAHSAVIDARGVIVATNRAWDDFAHRAQGCSSSTGVGANYLDICDRAGTQRPDAADEAPKAAAQLREVLAGTRSHAFVRYPCHGPTSRQWYQMRGVPLTLPGAGRLILVCHENITDATESQRALLEATVRVGQSERAMSAAEFASGLAHELNQPLAAVCNYASALLANAEAQPESRAAQALRQIHDQAHRANGLIKSMRALVHHQSFAPQVTDLVATIKGAVELSEHAREDAGCRLRLALPAALVVVRHDPVQIQQLLVNLIANAIEAQASTPAPAREVELALELGPFAGGAGLGASISVADRGPGVPPEYQARVFQPFFTTKTEGTGLGLMICKRISDLHEGRLVHTHRPGGGSVFCLTLPLPDTDRAGGTPVAA
jgi:two-component system sensor histidine kinase DctS